MFGLTKLSPEEREAHDKNKRIKDLELKIQQLRSSREVILKEAEQCNTELSKLLGG